MSRLTRKLFISCAVFLLAAVSLRAQDTTSVAVDTLALAADSTAIADSSAAPATVPAAPATDSTTVAPADTSKKPTAAQASANLPAATAPPGVAPPTPADTAGGAAGAPRPDTTVAKAPPPKTKPTGTEVDCVVIPWDWDDYTRVIEIGLRNLGNGTEYSLEKNESYGLLFKKYQKDLRLRVWGDIRRDRDGFYDMTLNGYESLDSLLAVEKAVKAGATAADSAKQQKPAGAPDSTGTSAGTQPSAVQDSTAAAAGTQPALKPDSTAAASAPQPPDSARATAAATPGDSTASGAPVLQPAAPGNTGQQA
ncbi:MAG TPA: hypothetical protein VJ417_07105, partial [Candidatus Glassbacteria bacterium]|nr:hypothetical protein [Candidatus Glassbacteria bacterium]